MGNCFSRVPCALLSRSVVPDFLRPHRLRPSCQAPPSMGILQARIMEWVAISFSRGSSQPRPPTLQVDSLLSETPGKLKNTGVGSLSLLQGIFLTQELKRGLLLCRQVLYQLSYQGSPTGLGEQLVSPAPFLYLVHGNPLLQLLIKALGSPPEKNAYECIATGG